MQKLKCILINSLLLSMIILLTLTPTLAASSQQAVGLSETNINDKRNINNQQDSYEIQSYSRWWFIPACSYGQRANVLFEVDTGPFTVDFYGTPYSYHGEGFCSADVCGYFSWAPYGGTLGRGEYIYFVTINGINPSIISGYCSTIASPVK